MKTIEGEDKAIVRRINEAFIQLNENLDFKILLEDVDISMDLESNTLKIIWRK